MSSRFDTGEQFVPPPLTLADLEGYLLTLQAQGWPEGLLVKQAVLSIQALHRASERWAKHEGGYTQTAPLWLDVNERDKLLTMLRSQRSTEARGIRQALNEMFPAAAGAE